MSGLLPWQPYALATCGANVTCPVRTIETHQNEPSDESTDFLFWRSTDAEAEHVAHTTPHGATDVGPVQDTWGDQQDPAAGGAPDSLGSNALLSTTVMDSDMEVWRQLAFLEADGGATSSSPERRSDTAATARLSTSLPTYAEASRQPAPGTLAASCVATTQAEQASVPLASAGTVKTVPRSLSDALGEVLYAMERAISSHDWPAFGEAARRGASLTAQHSSSSLSQRPSRSVWQSAQTTRNWRQACHTAMELRHALDTAAILDRPPSREAQHRLAHAEQEASRSMKERAVSPQHIERLTQKKDQLKARLDEAKNELSKNAATIAALTDEVKALRQRLDVCEALSANSENAVHAMRVLGCLKQLYRYIDPAKGWMVVSELYYRSVENDYTKAALEAREKAVEERERSVHAREEKRRRWLLAWGSESVMPSFEY